MNKIRLALILGINLIVFIGLNAQTVKIKDSVSTVEKFLEIRDKIATTPEGGATVFLLALKVYSYNVKLGKQCLVIAVDQENLQKGDTYLGYELLPLDETFFKKSIYEKNRLLPNSYISGSTPENNYSVKLPYTYEFSTNAASGDAASGTFKILVKCSGDALYRPITIKKNNRGLWKAKEWGSILNAIKKPPFDDKL